VQGRETNRTEQKITQWEEKKREVKRRREKQRIEKRKKDHRRRGKRKEEIRGEERRGGEEMRRKEGKWRAEQEIAYLFLAHCPLPPLLFGRPSHLQNSAVQYSTVQ